MFSEKEIGLEATAKEAKCIHGNRMNEQTFNKDKILDGTQSAVYWESTLPRKGEKNMVWE